MLFQLSTVLSLLNVTAIQRTYCFSNYNRQQLFELKSSWFIFFIITLFLEKASLRKFYNSKLSPCVAAPLAVGMFCICDEPLSIDGDCFSPLLQMQHAFIN